MGKWLKTTELIRFDVKDRVARITLNRPDKRNALSTALIRELHDALWEADDRTDVNVIILEGAGKDFCAGYDLVTTYSDRRPMSRPTRQSRKWRIAAQREPTMMIAGRWRAHKD
jgi:enoyl-CoA hydratase/carnithine racemase